MKKTLLKIKHIDKTTYKKHILCTNLEKLTPVNSVVKFEGEGVKEKKNPLSNGTIIANDM